MSRVNGTGTSTIHNGIEGEVNNDDDDVDMKSQY